VPLVMWRLIVTGLLAYGAFAVANGTMSTVGGVFRWIVLAVLLGGAGAGGVATAWTINPRHRGRLVGFILDFLVAVVAGFVAVNRMGLFTGLDTAGERFNRSAGWMLVIALGFIVSGLAEKAGNGQATLKLISRWTMIAGLAVLLIAMGILPGLVELGRRMTRLEVIPVLVLAVVAGTAARMLWGDSAARYFRTNQRQGEAMDGFLFVAPNLLGFLAFFAGPLVVSLFISFTDWDGLTDPAFVGFGNYVRLFSDSLFLRSLRNILVFGLVAVPAAVIPALLLAALLNSKLPGMKAFRAIYFLPSIAGVVGVSLIWKQLYNSTVGYLNYTILNLTEWVNGLFGTEIVAPQPEWISDSRVALVSVIILFAWQQIGFNTVLFLAGMQGIDGSLYEAADIDGAGVWTRFRTITVPLLQPTTVFVVATTTILALQLFNEPFILQSPSPPAGPNNSTLTPVIYLYRNAFQQFDIGYASAVAWALFIIIFAITLLYFRRQGEEGVLKA
jgi:ABC-type sugar transport system permease subunit